MNTEQEELNLRHPLNQKPAKKYGCHNWRDEEKTCGVPRCKAPTCIHFKEDVICILLEWFEHKNELRETTERDQNEMVHEEKEAV